MPGWEAVGPFALRDDGPFRNLPREFVGSASPAFKSEIRALWTTMATARADEAAQ